MKKFYLVLTLASLTLLYSCTNITPDELLSSGQKNEVPVVSFKDAGSAKGCYIVVFKENIVDDERLKAAASYEAQLEVMKTAARQVLSAHAIPADAIGHVYTGGIKGIAAKLNDFQLQNLKANPLVEKVEEDQLIKMDLGLHRSKGGKTRTPLTPSSGTFGVEIIDYGVARVGGPQAASSGKVWVLDTGIDLDHPDLNVDQAMSTNFASDDANNTDGNDGHGHGTHVAGIIGAYNDGSGVVGVAPGVSLVSVKVLSDSGVGYVSDVLAGLSYVAANASSNDVVNLSLGAPSSKPILDLAIMGMAGTTSLSIVMAAGNDPGTSANSMSPGKNNAANLFTIAAINNTDSLAYFSSFGSSVDFAAPGEDIYSTYKDGLYVSLSGTSMAAPHVAGLLIAGKIKNDGTAMGDPFGTPIIVSDN